MTPERNERLTKRPDNEQLKDPDLLDNVEDEMSDKLATGSRLVEKVVDLDDF